jgi:hypothetical protein
MVRAREDEEENTKPGDMKEGTGIDKGLDTAADVTSPENHAITTDNEDAPAGRTAHQPAQRPNSNKVPVGQAARSKWNTGTSQRKLWGTEAQIPPPKRERRIQRINHLNSVIVNH